MAWRALREEEDPLLATGEARADDEEPPKYWFEKEIGRDYLGGKLTQHEWGGWIMAVFVDSLFLHKSAFEAKEKALRRSLFGKLNKLAQGFFKDLEEEQGLRTGVPPQSTTENTDVLVGEWCTFLLCAFEQSEPKPNVNDEDGAADKRCQNHYPFCETNMKRSVSFKRLRMVWRQPRFMHAFPKLLEKLDGHRRLKFLLAMCVEVPDDLLHGRQFQHYDWTRPVKLARGSWNGGKFSEEELPPSDIVAVNPQISGWWAWLCSRGYRSKVTLFYTEVPDVLVDRDSFFNKGCNCTRARLDIVKCNMAIMCSNNRWNQFNTLFAQALAKAQWDLAWPFFVYKLLLDCIFMGLVCWYLSPVSRSTYHFGEEHALTKWADDNYFTLWVIVILGSYGLCMTLVEFFSFLCLFERGEKAKFCVKAANVYRLTTFLIELWACFVMLRVLQDYILPAEFKRKESLLMTHPFCLSALVFSKWCQLVLQFMNMSMFLDTLLPAWRAMVSDESMAFLLALAVMSNGTAMAYFALPVFDMDPNHNQIESIFAAIFRTAALNFMNQVDYDEFLGETDADKADITVHFHWALTCFSVLCGVLFPVIALNLYVGVLCVAYDKARKSLTHSEGVLHATTSSRYLLPLMYFPRCACCAIGCFGTIWCGQEQNTEEQRGTWIAMSASRARESHSVFEVDALDVNDTLAIMKAHVDGLEQVEQVEEKLEQAEDKLEKQVTEIATLAKDMRQSFCIGEQRWGQDSTQDAPPRDMHNALTRKVDTLAWEVGSVMIDVNSIKTSIEELKLLINAVKHEPHTAKPGCWRA